ncbi:MAG: Uncharacterized protein G01um101425_727 [Candidatus Peregrinibacteria bacterium Gr01-1014_25]|nr:MAG: Uncharacterized protein G01um101425_727 [Candidatus Peregrinibacteria bacterium Gr01-1014_25]
MRTTLRTAVASLLALVPLAAQAFGVQVIIDGRAIVFSDVPQSAWFATYVQQAANAGIVNGYKDRRGNLTGKFGPSNTITVAESLKIAAEGAGYDEEAYALQVNSGVTHWSSSYVSVAKAEGFPVVGRGGNIDRNATRAEVAALITAAFRLNTAVELDNRYTDVKANTDFATAIAVLSRDEVVSGDTDVDGQATGTFRPNADINRAEVAKMIINARAMYGTPGAGRAPTQQEGDAQTEANLVVYTNDGFSPRVLTIKKGEAVTFRNDTTTEMWVASDQHPTHTLLPNFDALKGFAQGETYAHTFTQLGSWGYHNHLRAAHQGTIVVE